MTLSPKDAFWIRNSYLGASAKTLAAISPDTEAVDAVVSRLAALGADATAIRDGAEHLLFVVSQLRIDVDPAVRAVKAGDVVRSALVALDSVGALEKALNSERSLGPESESRLFVAAAKALAIRDQASGAFAADVDPDLLALTGRDRERLAERLAVWLGGLRGILDDVVEAHGGPKPAGGRPPREAEAEALATIANFYIAATSRRPMLSTDTIQGDVTGDFVDFANLLCSYVEAAPFTDHDYRKLSSKLGA